MKILRYRKLARQIATDPETQQRIMELISDLEKELREIDQWAGCRHRQLRMHPPGNAVRDKSLERF
jgi:hypothetical protein